MHLLNYKALCRFFGHPFAHHVFACLMNINLFVHLKSPWILHPKHYTDYQLNVSDPSHFCFGWILSLLAVLHLRALVYSIFKMWNVQFQDRLGSWLFKPHF